MRLMDSNWTFRRVDGPTVRTRLLIILGIVLGGGMWAVALTILYMKVA